jgi:choline dehydrogenase-like flavoprotein
LKNIFYFAMSGERSGGQPIATIRSTIDPGGSHLARQNVEINEKEVQNSPRLVNAVRREVIKNWRVLRMVPIPFGAQLADFFRGNRLGGWHFGGTLPMRSVPEKLTECWGNGELNGIPRVFILDSSAFPSLPSSTIALLSAAHGHRVARTWCEHRSAEALP